ncbi:deleted in malignant brain tumors 1 protein-like [Polypterus senegalus]|uniref:deleted in malignant brain tumors 1 protein-like n=1 Tax=Polypterus senegalus TaxID=55291 RepID=UPI001963AB8A|nr:deleted in malignant brain tumors 1 protein-like [Polypterus senegalus]
METTMKTAAGLLVMLAIICPGYCQTSFKQTTDFLQTTPGDTSNHPYNTTGSCRGFCYGYSWDCSCNPNCVYENTCCSDFCYYCSYVNYEYCTLTTTQQSTMISGNGSCGSHLGGTDGTFTSPGYPYSYPHNAFCTWYIQVERGSIIELNFTSFRLESSSNCQYDAVSMYDGPSSSSPLIATICNNLKTTFESSSDTMTVVFRSDGSVSFPGFYAEYTAISDHPNLKISCSSYDMSVTLLRSYIESLGHNASQLHLNHEYCRAQDYGSEIIFRFLLNQCGTSREVINGDIIYSNNIRSSQISGLITRQTYLKFHVRCRMQKNASAEIMYKARSGIAANETGIGTYKITMMFYDSAGFYSPVTESPYIVDLNQELFVQLSLNSSDSLLTIFVDTCTAFPSPNEFSYPSYNLIRNGCVRDPTYVSLSNNSYNFARFKFRAFRFIDYSSSVYLKCKVVVCQRNDYSSRCFQGCQPRRKRALSSSNEQFSVVVGAIQLRDNKQAEGRIMHGQESETLSLKGDSVSENPSTQVPVTIAITALASIIVILVGITLKLYRNQKKMNEETLLN